MGESLPKKIVMSEVMSFCKMACNLFPICIGNKREKWSQVGHRYLFVYRFAQKSTCMRWTMIDDKGWSSHRFHTQHFFHIITIAFLLSTSTLTIPVANAPGATAQEPQNCDQHSAVGGFHQKHTETNRKPESTQIIRIICATYFIHSGTTFAEPHLFLVRCPPVIGFWCKNMCSFVTLSRPCALSKEIECQVCCVNITQWLSSPRKIGGVYALPVNVFE